MILYGYKIICIIFIYLPEADTFIGMRMFPTVHDREFPYVQANPHYCPGINYCMLINIFSAQLWFYHTYTHTETRTYTLH